MTNKKIETVKATEVDRKFAKIENPLDVETMQAERIPASVISKQAEALLQAEISRGYRKFSIKGADGKSREGRIWFPTVGDDEEANLAYSQAFTAFVMSDNLVTEDMLRKCYVEKGIWGKEQEDKLESIDDDMEAIDEEIALLMQKKRKTQKVKEQIVELYGKKREIAKVFDALRGKQIQLFSPSVEARAMEVALRAKLTCCVKDNEGNRIWADLDTFGDERDKEFVSLIINKALSLWGGLPDSFLEDSPEASDGNLE
jgi:hypothetical protein